MNKDSIPKLRIRKFNPDVLELRRIHGSPPTIVIIGKRGTGKCLGKGTKVMMSDGKFKEVQNIVQGDQLMGDDSVPRNVIGITKGHDKMYRIKQNKGIDYIVNGPHILSLKFNKSFGIHKEGDVIDIPLLEYLKLNEIVKECLMGYKADMCNDADKLSKIEVNVYGYDDYYGFELDGNHRFLIEDFTVCHNSTLIKDIMWHLNKTPMFMAMSGTEEGNGFYSDFMHPLLVHGTYKKEIVISMLEKQKKVIKAIKKRGIDPKERPELGTGLLLDDCGHDDTIMKQGEIIEIFTNGRHWKICFIASLQYIMMLPSKLRTNVDFVFCLRENIRVNQERLYKYFFGCFQKFAHFQGAFLACTNDYECMVLDNTSRSTNIEDCVFYYKANPDRKFKLGSKELWTYLDSKYKEESDSDGELDEKDKIKKSIIIKKEPMSKIIDTTWKNKKN